MASGPAHQGISPCTKLGKLTLVGYSLISVGVMNLQWAQWTFTYEFEFLLFKIGLPLIAVNIFEWFIFKFSREALLGDEFRTGDEIRRVHPGSLSGQAHKSNNFHQTPLTKLSVCF